MIAPSNEYNIGPVINSLQSVADVEGAANPAPASLSGFSSLSRHCRPLSLQQGQLEGRPTGQPQKRVGPHILFTDAAEALTNAAIGLIVSMLLTWLWLGFTPIQSAGITAVFFIASTVRSFIIRRCFRWVS